MKASSILWAVGAFAAAAALVAIGRRTGGAVTGDAERLSGVSALYRASGQQQTQQTAAVAAQWASLDQVFATQPDFYV